MREFSDNTPREIGKGSLNIDPYVHVHVSVHTCMYIIIHYSSYRGNGQNNDNDFTNTSGLRV